MSSTLNPPLPESELIATLDDLVATDEVQANCMFQLAIILARIALEPASEIYKEDTAQSLLALIRSKPKSNVVPALRPRRFGGTTLGAPDPLVLMGPHDPSIAGETWRPRRAEKARAPFDRQP